MGLERWVSISSTGWSSRGSGFYPQHTHGSLFSKASPREYDTHFGLCGHHAHMWWYMFGENTHTHKKVK